MITRTFNINTQEYEYFREDGSFASKQEAIEYEQDIADLQYELIRIKERTGGIKETDWKDRCETPGTREYKIIWNEE